MKKTLAAIAVVAMVFFASSAMAAGAKVPKTLCLDYTSYSDYHCLTMKKNGIISSLDGKVTMYIISGTAFGIGSNLTPVIGTAYVVPGSTTMRASYTGKSNTSENYIKDFELVYDLATETGIIYTRYEYTNGTNFYDSGAGVVAADCTAYSIPSANDAAGGETFVGE